MTRPLLFHRALSLSLSIAGVSIVPSLADTRAPLQVGVTVRPACQISSRLPFASTASTASSLNIRCPRGVPYALSIQPPVEPQPVATQHTHAQTITVIF